MDNKNEPGIRVGEPQPCGFDIPGKGGKAIENDGVDEKRLIAPVDTVSRGPVYQPGPAYIISGQAIKFVYRVGALLDDADARIAVRDRGQQDLPSHIWNDTKYWTELDLGSSCYLILGWYNRDNGNLGWVGVLNTEDYWWFRKGGEWFKLPEPNGSNFDSWEIGDQLITLYAKNPGNGGGPPPWTSMDIIFRYGWSFT